jgi:PAS domain S-box-containing protein
MRSSPEGGRAHTVGRRFIQLAQVYGAQDADARDADRYQVLFDSIDQGMCIVEVLFDARGCALDYRFLELNRAFEEQTGLVDAVGRRMRELRADHEQEWFDTYGRVALTGKPEHFERYAAALGRWFRVSAFRIDAPEQHRVGILFKDISDRKAAEQTAARLATLMDEFALADRRKDEFLATLAHELRNPLAPLRNGLQIARLTTDADSPLQRTIAMMGRQITQLTRLVDDLLDVSRISSGKVQLERRPLSLRQIVAASIEACETHIASHQHELTIEATDEELEVEGDANRLTQVFSNLLSNSAKYTEPGGLIRVRIERDGTWAQISVSDNGMGIPAEDLAHVFDLFSQVRVHQARAEGGLGIGLSLVHSLVRLHGGSVAVHSDGPGRGSTFIVRLPLVVEHGSHKARRAPRDSQEPRTVSRRILIADDNADAASSLAMLLELAGHVVATASDGVEAVEKAGWFKPQVVFLDLGMPRMNGIETARCLRESQQGAALYLVALTGWGQESDRDRTLAAGFDLHLVKPVSDTTIAEVIRALADGQPVNTR